eukprot:TRINITY_DN4033_c0_g1_i7.p1 TRINITY_DN4033_c0_g1~~TRINITY_DN4033_c0_g1_i7.p1  ORF type:complete len:147 (+),score=18.70 TRINITY_DN4033_c0_g1_i7:448-888(+)
MEVDGRSIAISPEGTRSPSGQLINFKKGPFHLALSCKVPLSPILLYGPHDLWPPGQPVPIPGKVVVQFCPRIAAKEYDQMDHNQLMTMVHKTMLQAIPTFYPRNHSTAATSRSAVFRFFHYIVNLLTIMGFYFFYKSVWTSIVSLL